MKLFVWVLAMSVGTLSTLWGVDHFSMKGEILRYKKSAETSQEVTSNLLSVLKDAQIGQDAEATDSGESEVIFPPSWHEVESDSRYSSLTSDERLDVASKWLKNYFIAIHNLEGNFDLTVKFQDRLIGDLNNLTSTLSDSNAKFMARNVVLSQNSDKLITALNTSQKNTPHVIENFGDKLQKNEDALQQLSSDNKNLSMQIHTMNVQAMGKDAFAIPPVRDPVLDNYLNEDIYHNYTVITPDGISQATVINNN